MTFDFERIINKDLQEKISQISQNIHEVLPEELKKKINEILSKKYFINDCGAILNSWDELSDDFQIDLSMIFKESVYDKDLPVFGEEFLLLKNIQDFLKEFIDELYKQLESYKDSVHPQTREKVKQEISSYVSESTEKIEDIKRFISIEEKEIETKYTSKKRKLIYIKGKSVENYSKLNSSDVIPNNNPLVLKRVVLLRTIQNQETPRFKDSHFGYTGDGVNKKYIGICKNIEEVLNNWNDYLISYDYDNLVALLTKNFLTFDEQMDFLNEFLNALDELNIIWKTIQNGNIINSNDHKLRLETIESFLDKRKEFMFPESN